MSSEAEVMTALIGSCFEFFAIRRDDVGDYHYLVRGIDVPRQVFLDSLEIARADRFDPDDPGFKAMVARHRSRMREVLEADDDERNVH